MNHEILNKPIIICGSGNSISEGNQYGLLDVLKDHITIGLNYWYKYASEPTFTTFVDWQFYRDNLDELKDLNLIIGKYDPCITHCPISRGQPKIDIQLPNSILLPKHGTFFGKDSLKVKYRRCRQTQCRHEYTRDWKINRPEQCPKCLSNQVLKYGVYTGHLSGLFALTLAVAMGFKEIYLLGFDCCSYKGKTHFYQDKIDLEKKNVDGTKIFHGIGIMEHTNGSKQYKTSTYNSIENLNKMWYKPYEQCLNEINIINVSMASKINVFPKLDYPQFLNRIGKGDVNQNEARKQIRDIINEKMEK